MKKFYLLFAAMAAVVLVNASTKVSLTNLKANGANGSGVCVTTAQGTNPSTSPALNTNGTPTLRLYAGNTITIDAGDVNIESVVLNLNSTNRNRLTTMDATAGEVVVDSTTWTATWSDPTAGHAAVTLTVGDKATLGKQTTSAGQIHIVSIDVTLSAEEGTCEAPQADTIAISVDTVIVNPAYFDEYGDVMFQVYDIANDVVMVFDAMAEAADDFDGTYSTADKSLDIEYTSVTLGMFADAEEELGTIEANVTVSTKDGLITIAGSILTEDNALYTVNYTGVYGIYEADPYQYEPDEVTTITEEASEMELDTSYLDYNVIEMILYTDNGFFDLAYVASAAPENLEMPLAVGTYNITDEPEAEGDFLASEGYDGEYDAPSFYGIWSGDEGYYDETYYLVGGTVTVAINGNIYTITVNATSAKGSTVNVTYTYEMEDTAVEDVEVKTTNGKIYNVLGIEANKNHRGAILIQDGKKFILR
ncbi:MAG: hypothetical protein IJ776_05880 [Paludibacteraceae bacterium]|nr:hypothetical protein [Paludibacteraceae bacterium]